MSTAIVDIPVPPPSTHQLALMIWIAVFPTLTVLNVLVGPVLADLNVVLRTLILVTVAVPVVIYGLMPRLHKVRRALIISLRKS
jgi:antibiotic biosynthesis monooxygenase (ABM) superfamily enzyme